MKIAMEMEYLYAMQKLLISATTFEIQPFLDDCGFQQTGENVFQNDHSTALITGIGLLETSFQLTKYLAAHKVDFVLQAGVAGAYNRELQLGEVVEISSEQYGDLGAEDHEDFLTVSAIPLPLPKAFTNEKLENIVHYPSLPQVSAISVNATAGKKETISLRQNIFQPDVESMEGLALFRVCRAFEIPCAQVRAISNYVEPRNKANWQMQLAIKNLNAFLSDFFL